MNVLSVTSSNLQVSEHTHSHMCSMLLCRLFHFHKLQINNMNLTQLRAVFFLENKWNTENTASYFTGRLKNLFIVLVFSCKIRSVICFCLYVTCFMCYIVCILSVDVDFFGSEKCSQILKHVVHLSATRKLRYPVFGGIHVEFKGGKYDLLMNVISIYIT